MSYQDDHRWSDQFIPAISSIVGPRLLIPASLEVDRNQAADLVVMHARNLTIACRVRRPGYAQAYPFEFTIRLQRASGATTEMQKIINGWGDWFFYGHAENSENTINRWLLVDLAAFRAQLVRNPKTLRKGRKSNGDGTEFSWFDIRSFAPEPPILIDSNLA